MGVITFEIPNQQAKPTRTCEALTTIKLLYRGARHRIMF